MPKKVILSRKKSMEGIFVYVLEYLLSLVSLDKMQNISTLIRKIRNLRAEHFESFSTSFLYCTHSSTYRLFWPSDQIIICIQIDYI